MKYLTINGQEKIQKELFYLTSVKRYEISDKLKIATDFGDLRENSEYDAALQDYSILENRIYELENILKNSTIYEKKNDGKVEIGSILKLDIAGDIDTYEIVGYGESDIDTNKILYETPLASALIGKKIGDSINVNNEFSSYLVKIIDIA